MAIPPLEIWLDKFNVTPVKIPVTSTELQKAILNFMESERPRIVKAIVGKKSKARGITILQATIIKTAWY